MKGIYSMILDKINNPNDVNKLSLKEKKELAKEIREYIAAAVEKGGDEITLEWINWAQRKADWYDPTVALEDDYLGKRNHGKSSEEKDKVLQTGPFRGWRW